MHDQQYEQERRLFDACAGLSPEQREPLLEECAAGDPALAERLRRLLAAHDAQGQTTIPAAAEVEQAPPGIGPYRILRPLGEGGMGVIYLAEQQQPLRRRVAIKVIKLGMDTRQVVARFLAERQALAVMDHPGIAKVLDAGATPEGRPYFVMELVEGRPLLQWCEDHDLSLTARVRLFAGVCHAVQHAHQKGVVHRDLKPGNILVTSDDGGNPAAKVIDFGIAKALEADLTDLTLETLASHVIGTPAYMSPEQAAAGLMDIDTRSDIYSLGVVLFQLLTGTLPHEPAGLPHVEFLTKLARCELEPPVPSKRNPAIPSDLDWVTMKAIAPSRERRYETALALADDLNRFLADEPVIARPPTATYRLGKFLRRHRAEALAAGFALFALVAGLVAASVGLFRATEAERRARQEAETARQVSNFLAALFESSDPSETAGATITARELLDRGVLRLQYDLQNQPEVQARLLQTLAGVEGSLGQYVQARDLALRAVQLNPRMPQSHLQLGRARARLGQFPLAEASFERAIALLREQAGEQSLDYARALDDRAQLDWQMGRFQQALDRFRQALTIKETLEPPASAEFAASLRGMGLAESDLGRFQESLSLLQRAQTIIESAKGPRSTLAADNLDSIALVQSNLKQAAAARKNHERALEIRRQALGPTHPVLAYSYLNLARLAVQQGRLAEAIPLYREGLRIREAALGADHPRTADIVESQAILHARMGELPQARAGFERALAIYSRSLGASHVETLESHRNLAILCVMQRQHQEAIRHLRLAVENGYAKEIHLEEKTFDPLRPLEEFREVERLAARLSQ